MKRLINRLICWWKGHDFKVVAKIYYCAESEPELWKSNKCIRCGRVVK